MKCGGEMEVVCVVWCGLVWSGVVWCEWSGVGGIVGWGGGVWDGPGGGWTGGGPGRCGGVSGGMDRVIEWGIGGWKGSGCGGVGCSGVGCRLGGVSGVVVSMLLGLGWGNLDLR